MYQRSSQHTKTPKPHSLLRTPYSIRTLSRESKAPSSHPTSPGSTSSETETTTAHSSTCHWSSQEDLSPRCHLRSSPLGEILHSGSHSPRCPAAWVPTNDSGSRTNIFIGQIIEVSSLDQAVYIIVTVFLIRLTGQHPSMTLTQTTDVLYMQMVVFTLYTNFTSNTGESVRDFYFKVFGRL